MCLDNLFNCVPAHFFLSEPTAPDTGRERNDDSHVAVVDRSSSIRPRLKRNRGLGPEHPEAEAP